MTISINSKIYLNNLSNPENSLVDSIKILSDFTIRDIKKIENTIDFGETYFSGSNSQVIRKKID